jgi:ureidoglycolate lyase
VREIVAAPLTAATFAPFGHVIETPGAEQRLINAGRCVRHHDLAPVEIVSGRAGISVFVSEPVSLPHAFDLVERHPEGSQAFAPLSDAPFLVIVAPDEGGAPGRPLAFVTRPGQGVSYRAGVWHGVLTPLGAPQRFLVVDRIGPGANLQEHRWAEPWTVTVPRA